MTLGPPRRKSRAEHVLDLAAAFARPHDGLQTKRRYTARVALAAHIEEGDNADGLSGVDALS